MADRQTEIGHQELEGKRGPLKTWISWVIVDLRDTGLIQSKQMRKIYQIIRSTCVYNVVRIALTKMKISAPVI